MAGRTAGMMAGCMDTWTHRQNDLSLGRSLGPLGPFKFTLNLYPLSFSTGSVIPPKLHPKCQGEGWFIFSLAYVM